MTEISAKPEKTYALVVGIEQYEESSWNVKGGGPVNDAIKFAHWLDRYKVPKENIRLCLSPLNEISDLIETLGITVEAATESNLSDIIENFLSQEKGDLLFIFWAGHGLIDSERKRRLLCSDSTEKNWRNIDFNSLLVLLASNSFEIRNHICLIDACANYIAKSPKNIKGKQFNCGEPKKDTNRFVLLATREGERAKVKTEEQTGYFSQAVREALETELPEFWPPNMEAIAKKVKKQFKSSDKKQLPTYFYRQSWDGNREEVHPNPFDIPHNIPSSQALQFIDRTDEIEGLHQLLQENQIVSITNVVQGGGGIGKTELAIRYSWYHLEDYPGGCCWLFPQEADRGNLGTQLVQFAIIKLKINIPNELNLAGEVDYCWENWQPGKVLLVFDNVAKLQQIQPYLPSFGSQFKILITTRQTDLPYPSIALDGLPPDAALKLFINLVGEKSIKGDLTSARGMCQLVNYIPLALYQMAQYARQGRGQLC